MARHRGIVVVGLTWNLFHGRDLPPHRGLRGWPSRLVPKRPLRGEFASWLAGRRWELALLQEAPPRWQPELARRCAAASAIALTSRNSFPRLRGALADRLPDLIASNEGGSNQVLVRSPGAIVEVRRLTLAERPERRRMLWAMVELSDGRRLAAANLHATANDRLAAAREVERAAERATEWAGPRPLVFGGDFNVRPEEDPGLFERLSARHGLAPPTAARALDHLLARGLDPVEPPRALEPERREVAGPGGRRIRLSDHAPVLASFGMR